MQGKQPSQPTNTSAEGHSHSPSHVFGQNNIGYIVVAFPIILLLGIISYKKYRIAVRRQQIAILEKIWFMDVNKKTH
jgi:hypothetical protein